VRLKVCIANHKIRVKLAAFIEEDVFSIEVKLLCEFTQNIADQAINGEMLAHQGMLRLIEDIDAQGDM
jgi:hypothetical protein